MVCQGINLLFAHSRFWNGSKELKEDWVPLGGQSMSALCQERVVSSRKWTRIHSYHWTQSGQADKKLEKWTPLLKMLIENDIFPVWTSVSLIYSSSQLCLSSVKHYTRMTSIKQDVIKKKLIFSKLWPILRFFFFC